VRLNAAAPSIGSAAGTSSTRAIRHPPKQSRVAHLFPWAADRRGSVPLVTSPPLPVPRQTPHDLARAGESRQALSGPRSSQRAPAGQPSDVCRRTACGPDQRLRRLSRSNSRTFLADVTEGSLSVQPLGCLSCSATRTAAGPRLSSSSCRSVLVTPSWMPEEREAEGRELATAAPLQVGPVTVVGDLEGLEELTLDEASALPERAPRPGRLRRAGPRWRRHPHPPSHPPLAQR
jgi:hypothetical protein